MSRRYIKRKHTIFQLVHLVHDLRKRNPWSVGNGERRLGVWCHCPKHWPHRYSPRSPPYFNPLSPLYLIPLLYFFFFRSRTALWKDQLSQRLHSLWVLLLCVVYSIQKLDGCKCEFLGLQLIEIRRSKSETELWGMGILKSFLRMRIRSSCLQTHHFLVLPFP